MNKFEAPEVAQFDPSRKASKPRFIGVAQTLLKPMKFYQTDHLETSDNTNISKIVKDYKQIWAAWIRPIWQVPEGSRNTIYRRRSNTIKTNGNQQN